MKQQSLVLLQVCFFMTSISASAFLFSNGRISSSRRIDNNRNPNSIFDKVQESTKLQVVDSPSLFSEAQEEERTRKLKLENIKSKIKEKTRLIYKNNHKKKMVVKPLLVDNIQDYKSIVVDETEQLVVVFFHAPWCKSCRVTKPLFQKVCQEYFHQVKFVHVPLTKTTAYLQQGLGVPSVPYVHIYHPNGELVEEMKLSKHYFQDFRNKLQTYVQGYCSVDLDGILENYNEQDEDDRNVIGEFQ